MTQTETQGTEANSTSSRQFGLLAWIISFLIGVPVLATQYLPLFDYPNHVARYALIGKFQDSAVFQQYFQLNEKFIPNLGFDIVATNLAKFMPVALAGQIVIFLSLFIASLGFCNLSFVLQKQRTWLAFVPSIFLLSFSFTFGFNNYVLAYAFLPWAIYCTERFLNQSSKPHAVAYPILILLAFMSHAQVAAMCIAFSLVFAITNRSRIISKRNAILVALSPLALVIPILALSPSSGEFSKVDFGTIGHKVKILYYAFMTGSTKTDLIFLILVFALAVAVLAQKQVEIPKRGKFIIAFAGLLCLVTPVSLAIASNLDARMVPILAALFFAFMRPIRPLKGAIVGLILVTFVFRIGAEFVHFRKTSNVIKSAAEQIEKLPDSAVVFNIVSDSRTVFDIGGWNPPVLSLPYAGQWNRPLMITGMYSYPNQQPIVYNDLGKKLSYLGISPDLPNDAGVQQQLSHHLDEIEKRMDLAPPGFWSSHEAYVFIGISSAEQIQLPKTLDMIHQEPKFILARMNAFYDR
jgi:hypothetical protein